MSVAQGTSDYSDCNAINGQPGYSTGEAQPRVQRSQAIGIHEPTGLWLQPEYFFGATAFHPQHQSGGFLSFDGSKALSMGSYSPASTTGMTLGVPTPSTGHLTSISEQSSVPLWGGASLSQEQRTSSQSARSLSPATGNDLVPQSPKSEKKNPSPRRAASAPEGRNKPRRKTHNAIEKRYRTRLNDKIAELRDRIPSLRGHHADETGHTMQASSAGDSNSHKYNKANILEKATEYIQYLETCNRRLQTQLDHVLLSSRAPGRVYEGPLPYGDYVDTGDNHSLPILSRVQPPEPFPYTIHDLLPNDTATFN